MNHILSVFYIVLAISAGTSLAFAPASAVPKSTCKVHTQSRLFAAPVGPVARAKKMMDPKEYDRVVKERMKKSGLSRQEAEDDYNNFLENPPFYYALEKKVSFILIIVLGLLAEKSLKELLIHQCCKLTLCCLFSKMIHYT
jgi:hypothetical protein